VKPTPRSVALEAITRVTEQGGYSNLAIPGALRRSGLSAKGRALATELAYGTIRRVPALDRAIERHSTRPVARMSRSARAALRLGAYQLLFTETPAYAAVSETVGLAQPRERGFVNAILRRVAEDPPPPPQGDDVEDVAVRTALAPWAVAELRRLVGDEAPSAAEALASRAPLSLRANRCRASVAEIEERLSAAGLEPRRGAVDASCLLLDGAGDPSELPGYEDGLFAVQDQASAFVVGALDPRPGERVLDLCAGPGGKAADIACRLEPDGVLVASDVRPRRAALVGRNVARLGGRALVLVQDGATPALAGAFDRVLVDAPCSGIGSARRRPELLWRPRREDLSGLARAQVAIASAAAGLLGAGGLLVYAVCTFPRAETDAACDAILRRRPDLVPEAIDSPDGRSPRVRLWPHRHGCDAMFVAAFRRTG
jgi:16S rRNA (cytosine967-C5)-methyltransferase